MGHQLFSARPCPLVDSAARAFLGMSPPRPPFWGSLPRSKPAQAAPRNPWPQPQPAPDIRELHDRIQKESAFVDVLFQQMASVVVGQRNMVERLLIGLVTGGHVLLEGVPGLAKTLTVKTLADCLELAFKRIQFTPDLLPADLIGTQDLPAADARHATSHVKRGPVFANVILADEINRAPAKVQSALLEAMQERQVTIGDQTFPLPAPFLVLATQNPLEHEGTYPLPEAQVDRFMLKVKVTYPTREEERQIMDRVAGMEMPRASPVLNAAQLANVRQVVSAIYIDPKVKDYMVDIVVATRESGEGRPQGTARPHRVRRLAARNHLPEPRLPGARVLEAPRVRHPRGREGRRLRRASPPRLADLRGRGRGRDGREADRARAGKNRSPVAVLTNGSLKEALRSSDGFSS